MPNAHTPVNEYSTDLNHSQINLRHDWQVDEISELFALPFNDLMFRAQTVHRQNFDPNEVQVSTLLSIKTGACPEDCKYCPQSAHNDTGLEAERLMKPPRKPVRVVSAWGLLGSTHGLKICPMCWRWCVK